MQIVHHEIRIETGEGIDFHDLTPALRELVAGSGLQDGLALVSCGHTTTALVVNENEPRLLEDLRRFLTRLAPPGLGYLHDDIELRDCPPDEPRNAHSHLVAMLLNSTESIAVSGGELVFGTWQSLLLVELDGPRERRVRVQLIGTVASDGAA